MKKLYILSPLVLLALFLFINASGGVGKEQNKDRTGSPAMGTGQTDGVCLKCHGSGINYGTVATMTLNDQNGPVSEYVPGVTYTLKLTMTDNGGSGHGFQLTGLFDNNNPAGLCTPITTNTQKTVVDNRWYFEHKQIVSSGLYEMSWIAPAATSGKVTFYGSALTVNGNAKTNGDEYVNVSDLVISEKVTTGITKVNSPLKLKMYPNPTNSTLHLSGNNLPLNKVAIFSNTGALVYQKSMNSTSTIIDVSSFAKGSYFVKSYSGTEVLIGKFMKN